MRVLAIETSCDETAAAVVSSRNEDAAEKSVRRPSGQGSPHGESEAESQAGAARPGRARRDDQRIFSTGIRVAIEGNVVASQINLHKKYGGVFPELASRAHTETIIPVIAEALEKANKKITNIDAIAVTVGPGLIGSLLVGVNAAKALAFATNKPLIPVNHLEGHIYANFIDHPDAQFPVLVLTVAGGHTQLVLMKKHLSYQIIGKTRDDSAGEAFDKVAKLLGLGYPGGPIIERLARAGDSKKYDFPRGMLGEGYDFSFSGLKTAVLYQTQKMNQGEIKKAIPDLVASFQQAVVDVLVAKTLRAAHEYKPRSVFLSGGVAANVLLRETLARKVKMDLPGTLFAVPELRYCTDNAAMIGAAAVYSKEKADWKSIEADPNASLAT